MAFSSDVFLRALHFAARAHGEQKTIAGLPYVVHLSTVSMEVACALRAEPGRDEELAMTCAVLHDVVEDTSTTIEQVAAEFGPRVAAGVSALTKNGSLPKTSQMADSLDRIRQQPVEIAIVKLADRITNTASPAPGWSAEKVASYRVEAQQILDALGSASPHLAERLRQRIAKYDVLTSR